MTGSRYLIVGAGGFGRECFLWLRHYLDSKGEMPSYIGYLDDDLSKFGSGKSSPPIFDTIHNSSRSLDGYNLIMAIGDPSAKKIIANLLGSRGGKFFTLLHPTAIIFPDAIVGVGCVICPHVIVSSNAEISPFVSINSNSTVGHDVKIGAYTTLSGHVDITGGCVVDDSVFFGSHAVLAPNVRIVSGSKVGAGSTVFRSLRRPNTLVGVPAKRIF